MSDTYYEETQDLLTELEVLFNSLDKGETAFDNLGPSIGFNLSIFFGVDALWLMGPALALALIYIPLHWWIERRNRDSWEAYLTRERDRIDRIGRILDLIDVEKLDLNANVQFLNRLKHLVDTYIDDTKALRIRLTNEKYATILGIQQKEKREKDSSDSQEEEKVLVAKEEALLSQLLGEERYQKYLKLTVSCSQSTTDTIAQQQNAEPENAEKKALEKNLSTIQIGSWKFDIGFLGGYGFNVVLSYGLAYWLIYYYSTAAVAGALATSPLGWLLLALTFPILYLIYKEFTTYRARLVETEAERNEKIDSDQLHFRRGWIFVGLIIAITLGVLLPAFVGITASILIAALSFAAVLLITQLVAVFIDERVKTKRAELANEKAEVTEKSLSRKNDAQRRRQLLDDIALITIQLAHKNKLAEQAEKFSESMTSIGINLGTHEHTASRAESIQESPGQPSSLREITFTEKARLILNVVLSGLMGYAVGSLLGFVLTDFLGHASALFLGPLGYIITGAISLTIGLFFARRAYYTEKIHQNALSTLHKNGEFSEKEKNISALDKKITEVTQELENLEKEKQKAISQLASAQNSHAIKSLRDLKPDLQFAHPVQNEGITKRKVLFVARAVLRVLVSVATASLMVRMLLVFGFAKLIPGVVGSSLMLFGASAGPLGFIVLGLALAVFLVKAGHDIYLDHQRQQEMLKIERADFTIKCKEAEVEYLESQVNIMTRAVKAIQTKASGTTESVEYTKLMQGEKSGQEKSEKDEAKPVYNSHLKKD